MVVELNERKAQTLYFFRFCKAPKRFRLFFNVKSTG